MQVRRETLDILQETTSEGRQMLANTSINGPTQLSTLDHLQSAGGGGGGKKKEIRKKGEENVTENKNSNGCQSLRDTS